MSIPDINSNGTRPKRPGWRRFLQFRIRTLLLLTLAAAVAMFFYTRPEVIEEQPMPGFHLKRQVYRTEDGTPVNQGWWELRDGEQHLLCEGRYRNDQPSGQWTWRHPSGRVRQQGEYRQGHRHGVWKTWYDDGRPREEWTYADGTLDGPARSWWPGGELASEGKYSAGQQSGAWTFCNEQGQQTAAGNYENGHRDGAWLAWDGDGNELPTQHYVAGRLIPDDKQLVAEWRKRLCEPAPVAESRRDSQNTLGETGPRAVAVYARRSEAAWALGRLGEPGLAVLDEAAGSTDAEMRALALLELAGQPKWTEANVPRLVAALDEPSQQVQLAVMLALSPLGSRAAPAVAKLEKLLGPGNGEPGSEQKVAEDNFPACVLATLVSIVPERDDLVARFVRAYPKQAIYGEAYDQISRYLSRSAQSGLLKAAQSGDAEVRTAALAALGVAMRAERFPPSAAMMQVFVEALGDADAAVRRESCEAIALFGPLASDLKPHLQKAASDSDPEVAKAAQNALQVLENGEADSAPADSAFKAASSSQQSSHLAPAWNVGQSHAESIS